MAKFSVMINRTRTIESSFEMEVSAKDEEAAVAKVEEKVNVLLQANDQKKGIESLDWEESSNDDSFEYDATAQ
jgi:hypothetical protein